MSNHLLVYVPGFPGEAIPRNLNEERVVDSIVKLSACKNIPLELVSYPGILNEEKFSFKNTQTHTLNFIKDKIEKGHDITLIGQSWGGLIALSAHEMFKLKKLILITPFILPLSREELEPLLNIYSVEFPNLIPNSSIRSCVDEISTIFNFLNDLNFNDMKNNDVRIIGALEDEIIPINLLREIVSNKKIFPNNVTFDEIKSDHNFTYSKADLESWLLHNV